MVESNDVYRKLQQHIDERMPVGFPRSESGADIRILKHLFTPEEANLVLYLSALPESIERDDLFAAVATAQRFYF